MKVIIPMEISDELANLIKNIIDQGYDPFDESGKFYREICTPYNSENGTDVLLYDREEYIYSTIESEMTCPSGCEMSTYSLDTKYITCECDVNGNGIVELDIHHISAKNIENSFLTTFKNTNYKVMICYNLVFNFKIFCHNYGSIIILIFFIIYVVFMIYYIIKDITPLKVSISKNIFEEQKKVNFNNDYIKPYFLSKNKPKSEYTKKHKRTAQSSESLIKSKYKKNKKETESFPPKKTRAMKIGHKESDKTQLKLIDILKSRNKADKETKSVGENKPKKKLIINNKYGNKLETEENLLNQKAKINYNDSKGKSKSKKDKQKNKIFDDFELNNMTYYDACEYDNRTCLKTYWSILKREHYVLFTFISRNDYNLFYIKIERFFILICTEVTMNGLFFVHETMYKKQTGGLSFAQKIPQFIFSLLVSHAVEIILCFLSMTDKHYYQIKALPQNNERNQKIVDILDCVIRKLTGFFVFTFLFFLFHWYFISAFCAVYQNTQLIYLRDSAISILTSFIDPFIIYGITCILRAISLCRCCRKKLSCVYKISDLIPIF